MSWLHYLLEANLYLAIFYTGYLLFLSRETYYMLNRAYLLFSCGIAFVLPVMQLSFLKPVEPLKAPVNLTYLKPVTIRLAEVAPVKQHFSLQYILLSAYLFVAGIYLLMLLIKLYQLIKITRSKSTVANGQYKLVYMEESNTAFSFFNYLYIGTKARQTATIIEHELVHIRQKHSVDIMLVEVLKIVCWFNPFVYLLQRSLRAVHEYIADEHTVAADLDALAYSSFLVSNAYGVSGPAITHSFFNYNLLKKRIIMLHQKRSGKLARLKYLLAVPLCAGLLCLSTLAFSKDYGWINIGPHRISNTNKSPQVPEPARSLLITQNGVSTITGSFKAAGPDGSIRKYTAYNLSNKDIVYLAKKGIVVNILSDVKINGVDKKIAQSQPVKLTDVRLTPLPKVHKFPPPVVTADTTPHKLPPPPPAAPAKQLPMVYLTPPPLPFDPAYKGLVEYLGKKILYPAKEFENDKAGNVVIQFNLGSDHKITGVKIITSGGSDFDAEVVRVMSGYPGTITPPADHPFYLTGVSFKILGGKAAEPAKDFDNSFTGLENYTCVAEIYGIKN